MTDRIILHSPDAAKAMDMPHYNLVNQIRALHDRTGNGNEHFIPTQFQHPRNKTHFDGYKMTLKGCELLYAETKSEELRGLVESRLGITVGANSPAAIIVPATAQQNQTPIEIALQIDEHGMTTAKKLYEFLELHPAHYAKWCKQNILENQYALESTDYQVFTLEGENLKGGRPTTDYKLSAAFAKKLAMAANSKRGDQARDYFLKVEDKLKETAREAAVAAPSNLPSELQMMKALFDNAVKHEERLNSVEQGLKELQQQKPREIIVMSEQMALPAPDGNNEILNLAMAKVKKSDRLSTVRIADMYMLNSINFYALLHRAGLVTPDKPKGWRLGEELEGKGYGFSKCNNGRVYHYIEWTPKGLALIKETLRGFGLYPMKQKPGKPAKHKAKQKTAK